MDKNSIKKTSNKNNKILLCLLSVSIGVITILSIIVYKNTKIYTELIKRHSNEDVNVNIVGVDTFYNSVTEVTDTGIVVNEDNGVYINGFSINNIFGFTNFKTTVNDGNCLGMCLTEKEYYMKNQDGISISYDGVEFGIDKNKCLRDFRGSHSYFYQLLHPKNESKKSMKEGFKDIDNIINVDKDDNFDKAIKTIMYYHNEGYKKISSTSFSPSGNFQFKKDDYENNTQKSTQTDIQVITDKIDNNEPVVLGFRAFDIGVGHALLGYGYEYDYDETDKTIETLKVYIIDPSCTQKVYVPSKPKGEILDKNSYVLFSKENDVWQFEYHAPVGSTYFTSEGRNSMESTETESTQKYNTELIIF